MLYNCKSYGIPYYITELHAPKLMFCKMANWWSEGPEYFATKIRITKYIFVFEDNWQLVYFSYNSLNTRDVLYRKLNLDIKRVSNSLIT